MPAAPLGSGRTRIGWSTPYCRKFSANSASFERRLVSSSTIAIFGLGAPGAMDGLRRRTPQVHRDTCMKKVSRVAAILGAAYLPCQSRCFHAAVPELTPRSSLPRCASPEDQKFSSIVVFVSKVLSVYARKRPSGEAVGQQIHACPAGTSISTSMLPDRSALRIAFEEADHPVT
jgi:hypothetical protein